MGPMGGPMDFGRNKSKFQEVPETGVTFDDVAVRSLSQMEPGPVAVLFCSVALLWQFCGLCWGCFYFGVPCVLCP